jgi:hypothetical protein
MLEDGTGNNHEHDGMDDGIAFGWNFMNILFIFGTLLERKLIGADSDMMIFQRNLLLSVLKRFCDKLFVTNYWIEYR